MRIGLVATLGVFLCACSGKGEEAATQQAATAAVAAVADDTVAAVLESQGTPFAKLRFVIESRPEVGKPFNLTLKVTTPVPEPHVLITLESQALTADPANALLEAGKKGDPGREFNASTRVAITARQEGLAELEVRLSGETDTPEAVYIIPVLVAKP